MDAIITAGGRLTLDDPLYAVAPVEKKALMPLLGKPMINWVAGALIGSGLVENLIVVGLKPEEVDFGNFPVQFVDAVGGIVDNILAAFRHLQTNNPAVQKVLICSSDIPLITPEIVRGFVAECGSQEADIYYAVVQKETMEARFPGSKRTYIPLKGGRFTGGDLFLADATTPEKADLVLLQTLTGHRKNYWQQARLLGFTFIFRFLLGRMTIDEAAQRAGKILSIEARAVVTRFAELGMDLDKPGQYEMIKVDLEKRQVQLKQV